MSKKTARQNALVVFPGPDDQTFAEESFEAKLTKEKRDFVRWVLRNIKSKSLQRHALEQASYYFANQRYDYLVALHRQRIESLLNFKIRLIEHHQKHQATMALEHQRLRETMAAMESNRIKILSDTKKFLEPPDADRRRTLEMQRQDRAELLRLKVQQMKRRALQQAVLSDARDRATARAQYLKWLKEEFDDEEVIQEALDEFDRAVFESEREKE